MPSPLVTLDVAHPPRHPDLVEEELVSAWSRVRNSPTLRVLKVIHGHGSTGKGGSTKEVVRNWAFRNRHRLRAVIDGESYVVSDADTQALRHEIGQYTDGDLGKGNPGITLLWIK